MKDWTTDWKDFTSSLPHKTSPYNKRNWGHPFHSICSYPGKLKPSIAYFLTKILIPENGTVLDPFSGAGTIPLEAAIQGKRSFAFDLSPTAYSITRAKLSPPSYQEAIDVLTQLDTHIKTHPASKTELDEAEHFGFNKTLKEYYHENTLKEIVSAREFFVPVTKLNKAENFVFVCLLHVLHGNRPYALSRRSHPLTPYAPSGEYKYKPLIPHVKEKIDRMFSTSLPINFIPGDSYFMDSTQQWPSEITNLDAIITSPPFFDSTRFYLANWLRLWFSGWNKDDFKIKIVDFIDERQKKDFNVYESVLRQSKERLNEGGKVVFHLGNSRKCDMAKEMISIGVNIFDRHLLFSEDVRKIEKHGIRDKGTVTDHSYLVFF